MTHDYKRNGTTTLFAALNVLDGTVIGRNMRRHRYQEFIRYPNAIERQVPAGKSVHLILDNYAAHKHPKVHVWLDRHQRFTFHFTPTSCSWLKALRASAPSSPPAAPIASSSARLSTCRPRSTASSLSRMPIPSRSSGPQTRTASVRRRHQMLDSIQ
jgi:hypothetical protein